MNPDLDSHCFQNKIHCTSRYSMVRAVTDITVTGNSILSQRGRYVVICLRGLAPGTPFIIHCANKIEIQH